MTRVTSISGLLQIMIEADEEAPELLDAWEFTEDSVRAYYDVINHALDRARTLDRTRKGAGTDPSFVSSRFAQRSLSHKLFGLFSALVTRTNVRL